jgi:hypothetical protein
MATKWTAARRAKFKATMAAKRATRGGALARRANDGRNAYYVARMDNGKCVVELTRTVRRQVATAARMTEARSIARALNGQR